MFYNRHVSESIVDSKNSFPAVLVTGPRQVGKSTVLKELFANLKIISLDSSVVKAAAKEDPLGFLQLYGNPVVIDEIQKVPELFDEVKSVIESNRQNGMYLLTGSQSFLLMKYVSESLAGRINILKMLGLSTREIYEDKNSAPFTPKLDYLLNRKPVFKMSNEDLWKRIHRGSYPELWANKNLDWEKFYDSYVQTYIERDVRDLTQVGDLDTFRKFMVSAAARTGQLLNYADIAKDVGVDQTTVKRWISILEASHLIELVQPFSMNVTKRIIKTPKLYFTDTGLVCYLTRWTSYESLLNGAMAGNIFETYVFGEIIKSYINRGKKSDVYFFRDTNGAEVDLLLFENNTLYPIEVKKRSNPDKNDIKHFRTMANSFSGIEIGEGCVICTISELLPIEKGVKAIPVEYL